MTKIQKIDDYYTISRSIIEPTHIDQYGKLKLETFTFSDNKAESVNCNDFVNSVDDIHSLGQSLEGVQNKRLIDNGKTPNRIYRGYIESAAKNIRAVKIDKIHFDIEHAPNKYNGAHCNIEIKTTDKSKPQKAAKILAVDNLRGEFSKLIPVSTD
jgi:hypothetical protein